MESVTDCVSEFAPRADAASAPRGRPDRVEVPMPEVR